MKNVIMIVIGVLIGLLTAGLIILSVRQPVGEPIVLLGTPTPEPILVYVRGAVKNPGVYKLPRGSRLSDAVLVAGGFLPSAKIEELNLAEKLVDSQDYTIEGDGVAPTPQLNIGDSGLLLTPTPNRAAKLNINTASAEELDNLPGIGPTTAKNIVQYRTDNGLFTKLEELLKIPGFGPSTLNQIRDLVKIGE